MYSDTVGSTRGDWAMVVIVLFDVLESFTRTLGITRGLVHPIRVGQSGYLVGLIEIEIRQHVRRI